MGTAPTMTEEPQLTPEQLREASRAWFLDTGTGDLRPEEDPAEDRRLRPKPIRVALQIFD